MPTIPVPPDQFANPFIRCTACDGRVTNVSYPGHVNIPCGHADGTFNSCWTWSPVDGCKCTGAHARAGDG